MVHHSVNFRTLPSQNQLGPPDTLTNVCSTLARQSLICPHVKVRFINYCSYFDRIQRFLSSRQKPTRCALRGGVWCVVRGVWCVMRGAWCVVCGVRCVESGEW